MSKNLFKKKITLYLIYKDDKCNELLTVVSSKKQINEFIDRMIIVDNWEHYMLWCDLKSIDYKDVSNHKKYIDNYIITNPEEVNSKYSFVIQKVIYTKDLFASILRMFNGCTPIGCSYENTCELTYITELYSKLIKDNDIEDENKYNA